MITETLELLVVQEMDCRLETLSSFSVGSWIWALISRVLVLLDSVQRNGMGIGRAEKMGGDGG